MAAPAAVLAAAGDNPDKALVLAQIRNARRERQAPAGWIALPSIRRDRNYPGRRVHGETGHRCGFAGVKIIPTPGKPGVFGRLDSGAKTTVAVYFMYDVKPVRSRGMEFAAARGRLVEKTGLGTVCMGRGAVNQKGPQNSFLSALMAFQGNGQKMPVNLVLVCEARGNRLAALRRIVNSPDVLRT